MERRVVPNESIFSVSAMWSTELMERSYTVTGPEVINAGPDGRDDTLVIKQSVE